MRKFILRGAAIGGLIGLIVGLSMVISGGQSFFLPPIGWAMVFGIAGLLIGAVAGGLAGLLVAPVNSPTGRNRVIDSVRDRDLRGAELPLDRTAAVIALTGVGLGAGGMYIAYGIDQRCYHSFCDLFPMALVVAGFLAGLGFGALAFRSVRQVGARRIVRTAITATVAVVSVGGVVFGLAVNPEINEKWLCADSTCGETIGIGWALCLMSGLVLGSLLGWIAVMRNEQSAI